MRERGCAPGRACPLWGPDQALGAAVGASGHRRRAAGPGKPGWRTGTHTAHTLPTDTEVLLSAGSLI